MGGTEGRGGSGERWSLFGMRPIVQKSPTDPGSDSSTSGPSILQSYFGARKSSSMEELKPQLKDLVEDPGGLRAAHSEISTAEEKRGHPRPHRLKPRDMNILMPSGF